MFVRIRRVGLHFISPGQSHMTRTIIGLTCLVFGVGVLLVSLAWGRFFPAEAYWGAPEQKEFADAMRSLKEAAYRPGRRADLPADDQLLAAQARFDAIQTKLEHAMTLQRYGRAVVGMAGVALLSAGSWLLWTRPRTGSWDRPTHLTRSR